MSDPAKTRLITLTLVRLAGIIVGGAGMALLAINRAGAIPPIVLLIVGFGWTLIAPLVLLRRWRQ